MASRKNRSRKSNRRSPKKGGALRNRLRQRWIAVVAWIEAHRWHSFVAGLALVFVASLFGGYWLAERLESKDDDALARGTIDEMRRATTAEPAPRYARIED